MRWRHAARRAAAIGKGWHKKLLGEPTAFRAGHFYSPVVDPGDIDPRRTWPDAPEIAGIDFNEASHRELLTVQFPRFLPLYDYADTGDDPDEAARFHSLNSQFGWLDSRALFVFLHAWQPRRVIEVGSGFSSLLVADVNRRWRGGAIDVTCIEPYPRAFLKAGVDGITRLVEEKVQNIDRSRFLALEAGDVLFVDSSHVAKTGSDVNFLFFDVLPHLAPGVYVHIHDIFLPHDYPREWVQGENRSWNEQYVLRALLMHSAAFEVVFGCSYAMQRFPDLVQAALALPGGAAFGGSSFWIRKR